MDWCSKNLIFQLSWTLSKLICKKSILIYMHGHNINNDDIDALTATSTKHDVTITNIAGGWIPETSSSQQHHLDTEMMLAC